MKLDPNTIAANLNAAAAAEAEAAAADPQNIQIPQQNVVSGSGQGSAGLGGSSNASKIHYPRDIQVVQAMLKELNIQNYDKRVVPQILDFAYRKFFFHYFLISLILIVLILSLPQKGYVQNVLEDAELLSSYAKKKVVDADDIHLSLNLSSDRVFVGPPSRDHLLEVAALRNSVPLPAIRTHNGMRLPVDRYSLVSANVSLISKKDS